MDEEKTRQDLKKLYEQFNEKDESSRLIEQILYNLESEYLHHPSGVGNVIHGYDASINVRKPSIIKNEDRIFSNSSITSPLSIITSLNENKENLDTSESISDNKLYASGAKYKPSTKTSADEFKDKISRPHDRSLNRTKPLTYIEKSRYETTTFNIASLSDDTSTDKRISSEANGVRKSNRQRTKRTFLDL